jgi:hypothetical protein
LFIPFAENLMDKIDKIINIIRVLKEEGAAMMTTSSTPNKAGFGGSAQGFDPGPTAGYDKPLDGRSKIMRRLPPQYRKQLQKGKKDK